MPPKQAAGDAAKAAAGQPPPKKKAATGAMAPQRPGSGAQVVIGKDDSVHPNKPMFASQILKKPQPPSTAPGANLAAAGGANNRPVAPPAASAPAVAPAPQNPNQLKWDRAQIAKRELAEMDAIERAFREDAAAWAGPTNVVYPRRYHRHQPKEGGEGDDEEKSGRSAIDNPYATTFCGARSRGWMYGEGHAGIGGRSWAEATSGEEKKDGTDVVAAAREATTTTDAGRRSRKAFLVDDVTIIDNALRTNGLSRSDVTPRAYACLLEQARRFALELLADAQDCAIHAKRGAIPSLLPADLILAAELRDDYGIGINGGGVPSTLPSPERIAALAAEANRAPLPPVPVDCHDGVALPPKEQRLTARTYDVVDGARTAQRMARGGDLPMTPDEATATGAGTTVAGGGSGSGSSGPSGIAKKKKRGGAYGAGTGRRIAVHIKGGTSSASAGRTAIETAASAKRKAGQPKAQKRKLTEL